MKKYIAIVVDEEQLVRVVETITSIPTAEITAIKAARESDSAFQRANRQQSKPAAPVRGGAR